MKRWKYILIPAAVLLLVASVVVFRKDTGVHTGSIVYDAYGVSFSEELTREEADQIAEMLKGKHRFSTFFGFPACGFDGNVAIVLDGVTYEVALDTCGTLLAIPSMRVINLSDDEIAVIHGIFERHGGEFPCV